MLKWREVESVILKYIAEHSLREGDKVPSDRKFAQMAHCSLQPVLQAMRGLVIKGLIQRRAGAATTVLAQAPLLDDREFSFSHIASREYGPNLKNKLLELTCRLPMEGNSFFEEKRVQKILGLKRKEPFYVIARLRILDDKPRVVQRTYLNPTHFSPTFLADHNFEQESLIGVYNASGFHIEARNTTLRARFPTPEEKFLLQIGQEPILEAAQEMEASNVSADELVTIEFMRASYVNWVYHVANRRTPEKGGKHG